MSMLRLALEDYLGDPWTGFDLDRTLAVYDEWRGIEHIGEPIPEMVNNVKELLANGDRVKIFTARVAGKEGDKLALIVSFIEQWCLTHIGEKLEVTAVKDGRCICIYDDIAKQVVPNTGEVVE